MKRNIQNLQETKNIINKIQDNLIKKAANQTALDIENNFSKKLKEAKKLLKDLYILENDFKQRNIKKSFAFSQAGRKDFENWENKEEQDLFNKIKQLLIKSFSFIVNFKKDLIGYEEKFIVGIGDENIVGILKLKEFLKSATLALDRDEKTLKLMVGKFDVLQKSISNSNKKNNINNEMQQLQKILIDRYSFILDSLRQVNKGKNKKEKTYISAGFAFEIGIKSLKYKDSTFYKWSAEKIEQYYKENKSRIPFFREGDITNTKKIQTYLDNNPNLIANEYSVKFIASSKQSFGPSIVSITTLKNAILSIIYILSSDLSSEKIKEKLINEVFSTKVSEDYLKPEKIKTSLGDALNKTVIKALEKYLNIS